MYIKVGEIIWQKAKKENYLFRIRVKTKKQVLPF
uniref:Uncharacterized protein n=1 Tax=Siphoviridae sp. ct2D011 TaxID=2825314 RepID=A0A8S5V9D9_9CAUD|nr:MAG TPA: hypothetical protein [Siphoviridae sp. ct2D011]